MRTFLLMLGTVVVIALAAGVYVWMQPATQQARTLQLPPASRPASRPSEQSGLGVHKGEGAFFTVDDPKTRKTAWQFRASRWDPQTDNSVLVTDPEAEFFLDEGQILSLKGARGRVVLPSSAGKNSDLKSPNSPPSRGELHDVIISLYNSPARDHATLVCKVNNVSFDNDTFRIATEAYKDADGKLIPADQVPVEVIGDEQDFYGRGLTILWNDRERHLQLLEIAHGESLAIKSEGMLGGIAPREPNGISANGRAPASATPAARTAPASQPRQETAASRSPATRPVAGEVREPAAAEAKKPSTQPVYLATFDGGADGVQVVRADQTIASGAKLIVQMRPKESTPGSSSAVERKTPATKPVKRAAAPQPKAPRPTRTTPQVATAAAPAATTQEAIEPVVVYWSGPVRIVPLDEARAPKLKAGDSTIEMLSDGKTPVVLHQSGTGANSLDREIECTSFLYSSADESLIVRSSPQFPLISMRGQDGSNFLTPSIVYRKSDRKAVLEGASRAEMPHEAGMMKLSWSQRCILTMFPGAEDDSQGSPEKAEIVGDVIVDDAKLKLKSDSLTVEFAQSDAKDAEGKQTASQVKAIVAAGNVNCEMLDEQGKSRRIESPQLILATEKTATGEIIPREITAIGKSRMSDETQDMRAEQRIRIALAPTTRRSDPAKVESLIAQGQVAFNFKDGGGTAALLEAVAVGESYNVTLSGEPAALTRADSTLSGRMIKMQTGPGNVEVVGPGSMRGTFKQDEKTAKATPFDVQWTSGMSVSGESNRIDITGGVLVSTVSPTDGSLTTITGEKATMELADGPPSTQPSAPTTRDAAFGDSFGSLKNKVVRTLTIDGGTKMDSVLADASGTLLRRIHMAAPLIRMEGEGEDKRFIIPSAGRMLFEERTPTTQPTTAPTSPFGNMKGATAFQWQKQLTFDQSTGRADMNGDVIIVHGDDEKAQDYFKLLSDDVITEFDQDKSTGPKSPGQAEIKLKKLVASGNVKFSARQVEFLAPQMSFDPGSSTLTATGDDIVPVRVFEANGAPRGALKSASWNTQTWQITVERAFGQFAR